MNSYLFIFIILCCRLVILNSFLIVPENEIEFLTENDIEAKADLVKASVESTECEFQNVSTNYQRNIFRNFLTFPYSL